MDYISGFNNNLGRNQVLDRLAKSGKPVVIYGTGKFAFQAANMIKKNDIEIQCFLDDDEYWFSDKKAEVGGEVLQCVNRQLLHQLYREENYNIVVGFIDYRKTGVTRKEFVNCDYVEYLDAVDFHIMLDSFLSEYQDELDELFTVLQDEKSKKVMKAYIWARYSGDVSCLCDTVDGDELYDWKLLDPGISDVIIDGGAYTGDTIDEILEYMAGKKPNRIYAFEPSVSSFNDLINHIDSIEYQDCVIPVNLGLSDSDETLSFSGGGTLGDQVDLTGDEEVKVIALDMHKEFRNATIVKMDIEGSEVDALKGMKSMLKNHPRLAVCVYHRNPDLIDIYNLLKEYDYKFYLRQHSYSAEETVLYAI